MGVGVCVVQTVNIAQQHQEVRSAQPSHDGGEGVVVAQDLVPAGFDLGRGDGVVLVHHRDDAHLQQGGEGAAQVFGPLGDLHVVPGQEDLGHGAVVLGEELVVDVHHPALPHGGSRLLHPKFLGPLGKPQLGSAHGDGTGSDQDHLVPHAVQVCQRPDQMFHAPKIQRPGVVGQGRGTHLDHDALLGMFCH